VSEALTAEKSASPRNLAQVNAQAILGRRLRLRIAVGENDTMLTPNAELHAHLMSLGIPHRWRTYPGVAHEPLLLMQAMGPANWEFSRGALAPCTADLTDVGDTGAGSDAQITLDGVIAFINAFSDGC
jgi:acetyl esterase/lipase